MSTSPRAVFGMTAYNRPDTLARTLESLLSQTYERFAIVIVDDCPSAEVRAVVDAYSSIDPRITYEANPVRLGMIGNWKRAFVRSRELHPGAEYFAWVSDHDVWHPRWLEELVGALDGDERVVLAYPQMMRVYENGMRAITRVFDTVGVKSRVARMRGAIAEMTAGNGIYGLFRISALMQAGVFRSVLMPDRQVLVALSLFGEFRHVRQMLWYREVAGAFSLSRQRRMLFAGRVPLSTYVPPPLQHFALMVWDFVIRGNGRPAFGRVEGAYYAISQLWYTVKREVLHDDAWWRSLAMEQK